MKKLFIVLSLLFCLNLLIARPVEYGAASRVARERLRHISPASHKLEFAGVLAREDRALAYVFELEPLGYMVVSADDLLPPVIAWSLTSSFGDAENRILAELITADLANRLEAAALYSEELVQKLKSEWETSEAGTALRSTEQWPPEGYSTTGGWIKTLWNQSAPFNSLCPMDPVTNARSVAGCPAIAIAQIINYHETINGTVFSDADDYYHSYAGRTYWIDNDFETLDFPSFPQLNTHLTSLMESYRYQLPVSEESRAALIFAAGVAARQVYTSSGSGTFQVSQAYDAIVRFGFEDCELITLDSPELYDRMAQNMMEASPVLLAVVTPAWDAGHNVVVDGYRSDGFFHLNFGWGGSYNGWYNLPSGIPYNLTVLEGAVLDIAPREYIFAFPEEVEFIDIENCGPQAVEMLNISDAPLVVEALMMPMLGGTSWSINPNLTLPATLLSGESMIIIICPNLPVSQPREVVEGYLRIIHAHGVKNILIRFDTKLITSVSDESIPPASLKLQAFPNPFVNKALISYKPVPGAEATLKIYNLKGQLVKTLSSPSQSSGIHELEWDGCNEQGQEVGSGIYLLKLKAGNTAGIGKILRLE